MEIQNKKLDEGVFMQERQEVLGQWPDSCTAPKSRRSL